MKKPFLEEILMRNGERALIKVKKKIFVNGGFKFIDRYEIWFNIEKYEQGIAAEVNNLSYFVHMQTLDTKNETQAKEIFMSLK